MPNIGPVELVVILVIALVVIGPGKLPEVGSALGKSIKEFRKAATDVRESTNLEPAPTPPPATPVIPATPIIPATPGTPPAPPVAAAATGRDRLRRPPRRPARPGGAVDG